MGILSSERPEKSGHEELTMNRSATSVLATLLIFGVHSFRAYRLSQRSSSRPSAFGSLPGFSA